MLDSTGDGIPERSQSLHDNLLGNFDPASITDKFMDLAHGGSNGGSNGTADNALGQQLLTLSSEYASRGVFSGEESQIGGAKHDSVRAFDWDAGWERSDWIDAYVGKADGLATKDTNGDGIDDAMNYGTGNPIDQFSIVRHEGAGVELAIKAEKGRRAERRRLSRRGDLGRWQRDRPLSGQHRRVPRQCQPCRLEYRLRRDGLAKWLGRGRGRGLQLQTEGRYRRLRGVNLIELELPDAPNGDSVNIGFAFLKSQIDADPNTSGVQPYNFGEGEFDVVLEAYEDGALLAQNHIRVHVNDAII